MEPAHRIEQTGRRMCRHCSDLYSQTSNCLIYFRGIFIYAVTSSAYITCLFYCVPRVQQPSGTVRRLPSSGISLGTRPPYYQMAGWQRNINPERECNWALKIITRLRTGRSAVRVRAGARKLSILRNVQNGSGAHAVSYSMGAGASFPWRPFRRPLASARSPKLYQSSSHTASSSLFYLVTFHARSSHSIVGPLLLPAINICLPYLPRIPVALHINLQAPCIIYTGQTYRYSPEYAFYIFSQQVYFIIFLDFLSPSPFIPPQNVVYFLMLPSLVHKIFTFYINGVLNCKFPAPGPKSYSGAQIILVPSYQPFQ